MKAILRRTRISPKKANLIAELVRNKKITEAIDILTFTPKKAAKILKKVIESAAANAENNFKQEKENLIIKEIIVTQGPTYKRSLPISRGRMHPILKRTSHITVKLELCSSGTQVRPEQQNRSEAKVPKTTKVKEESKESTESEPKPKKPNQITKS